ncbi:MAG: hypothetical protein ACTJFS_15775 [Micrococcaceae bacterium]|uniref:hypothetical protein n=1 Tax=Microbacterium gubbeenense TaxID=159896 RepID=UPI00048FE772|nr:hypothetical protein [Microbacterium gubbeenense]
MRTKQLLPYVLAVGGLGSAAVALTLIVTAFTSQNAPVIQVLMFGLSPLLSFVAVITALRPAKDLWGVASLGSAGIIAACAAHMSWYTLIDAESPTGATFAWPLLITTAVLLIAGAGALFLWRSLAQKVSQKVAIAMSILVGMVSGGVIVPVLATPGAAPTIAIAVLVVIAVLHRREIRAMRQRAPLET